MNTKYKKKTGILLLVLLLLGVTIGYSALSQTLNINGNSKIKGSNWDIHFESVKVNSNSVTLSTGDSAATINPSKNTEVNYTVTLKKPGDFYEFTVDAVNKGSIDGMVSVVSSKLGDAEISTTNPLPKYLNYSVTYEDGDEILENHLLAANTSETYKVRVEYRTDINSTDLPSAEQTFNFKFEVTYDQADNNAVLRYVYSVSDTIFYIGSAILEGETTYTRYTDAVADFGHPFFVRHTVKNEKIEGSSVGFVLDGKDYYLQGAGATYNEEDWYNNDSIYYETNKATLKEAFGEENCSEYIDSDSDYRNYSCSASGLNANAYAYGDVYADDDGYNCYVFSDGSSSCGVFGGY